MSLSVLSLPDRLRYMRQSVEAACDRLPVPMALLVIFGIYLLAGVYVYDKSLDLTDAGYHLVNQRIAGAMGFGYLGFMPPYWLSDVVAAFISKLFGGWTLLQMRMTVIIFNMIPLATLVYLTWALGQRLTVMAMLFLSLAGLYLYVPYTNVMLVLDYYTLPNVVGCLYLLGLSLLFMPERRNTGPWPVSLIAGLALLAWALLNLRAPTGVLLALLPALLVFVGRWLNGPRLSLRLLGVFYAVLMAGLGYEGYALLQRPDILAQIRLEDWHNPEVHNPLKILEGYVGNVLDALQRSIFLWAGLGMFLLLELSGCWPLKGRWRRAWLLQLNLRRRQLPVLLLFGWGITLLVAREHAITSNQFIVLTYLILGGVGLALWQTRRDFFRTHAPLLAMAAFFPLSIFVGTNTGITKIGYGLPVLLSALYVMIGQLPGAVGRFWQACLIAFFLTAMGVLCATGLTSFYENVHYVDASALTYRMREGKVAGTLSRQGSGPAVDEVLVQIAARTQPHDKIFVYLTVPMIYFAADRPEVIDDLPNFDVLQPAAALKRRLSRLCTTPALTPKLIVHSRAFIFDKQWPVDPESVSDVPVYNYQNDRDNALFINAVVVQNCHPQVIWQNRYFELMTATPSGPATIRN